MSGRRRGAAVRCLLLALAAAAGARAAPQDEPPRAAAAERVVAIDVTGNARLTAEQILAHMRTRVGLPLDRADVARDIEEVYQRFGARLTVLEVPADGGVRLVLQVDEVPFIERVETRGVAPERGRELLERVGLDSVRTLLFAQVAERAAQIEDLLRDEGRYLARVKVVPETRDGRAAAVLEIDEGEKVEIDAVEFVGIERVDEDKMRAVLTTQPTRFLFLKSWLKQDALDRDVVELERQLRREGFRDGTVALGEIRFDDEEESAVVVFRVTEGERYTVSRLALEGVTSLPEELLRREIELDEGGPLRAATVEQDQRRIETLYGRHGFVRARATAREELPEEGTGVAVTYVVAEGGPKHVRDVVIRGNTSTRQEVVRREITLEPGDLADVAEARNSRDRLRALGYFRDGRGRDLVSVEFRDTSDPLLVDLFVDVEESTFGGISFGAGATTDTGFFAGVSFDKRNFDIGDTPSAWDPITLFTELYRNEAFHGAGQTLNVQLYPGNNVSTFRLTFIEPYLSGPVRHPDSLAVEAYATAESLFDEYTETRIGATTTLGRELDDHTSAGVLARFDVVDIGDLDDAPDDVDEVEGWNVVPAVGLVGRRHDLDRPIDPREGYDLTGRWEVLGVDAWGQRGVAAATRFVPLHEDERGRTHRLVLRGALGAAHGFGDELPFFERLRAGGTSGDFPLRGFEYRGIGPEDENVHLGGALATTGTAEYQFPLYSTYDPLLDEEVELVRGVVFVDAGSLEDEFDDLAGTPRLAVGTGLRIRLPFLGDTPISVDLGVPLLSDADDDTELLSFKVTTRF